jgi:hypothetical protein
MGVHCILLFWLSTDTRVPIFTPINFSLSAEHGGFIGAFRRFAPNPVLPEFKMGRIRQACRW